MNQPLNIHPIIVHFPIALLTIYALMECIRLKKIILQPYWFYVKAIFVIIGTLGGYLALYAGGLIEDEFRAAGFKNLIDVHSTFADLSIILFTIISVIYGIIWISSADTMRIDDFFVPHFKKAWAWALNIANFILRPYIIIPLALIGLVTITITGALGGAIALGTNTDPFTTLIYHLFVQ